MQRILRHAPRTVLCLLLTPTTYTQPDRTRDFKPQVIDDIEAMKKQSQVMNDMVFSFAELGFQEFETSKYLTEILEKEGFTVERGIAGIPTAWMATWGSGKPVIALAPTSTASPRRRKSRASRVTSRWSTARPGTAKGIIRANRSTSRPRSPSSGSWKGQATGHDQALAGCRRRAARDQGLPGARRLLQGCGCRPLHARRQQPRRLVGNGQRDRHGVRRVHVSRRERTCRSRPLARPHALDAVELMNIGWNFRREHLRPQQRSHYVITDGGDQPNVVPPVASVWYYFRELDYPHIKELRESAIRSRRAPRS